MLPQSDTRPPLSTLPRGVEKSWAGDADQPYPFFGGAQHVERNLVENGSGKGRRAAAIEGVSMDSRGSGSRPDKGKADSLPPAALDSAESKETWRSIAAEADTRISMASYDSMPVKVAVGEEGTCQDKEDPQGDPDSQSSWMVIMQ